MRGSVTDGVSAPVDWLAPRQNALTGEEPTALNNVRFFASLVAALLTAVRLTVACASALDMGIGAVGAVATDMHGSVYFSSPNIVLKLDAAGRLTRMAGNGTPGYSGDGGPAATALLNNMPFDSYPEAARDPIDYDPLVGGLAVDAAGNLYIADAYNNRVRKVAASGIITTMAGGDHISWPQGVAADGTGTLYVASAWGTVLRVASSGVVGTLANPICGPGYLGPGVCAPEGIALAPDGALYVADGYCRVRKISSDGTTVTVAGDDTCGHTRDTGPATKAALAFPYGVAVDKSGNLVIADTYNHCIRRVDAAGNIATVAGTCGTRGFSGDGGTATNALLDRPYGVAADSSGNLFIADTLNQRIRRVSADGTITTVAGSGPDLNQHGLTGSWYEAVTSGQGLEVEIFPNLSPGSGFAQVSWFTFDTAAGGADHQRWYTISGSVATGQPNASLTIYQNIDGNLNAPPVTTAQAVGTATLTFDTCSSGKLSYTFTDGTGRMGNIPLTRLTQNVTCATTMPFPTNTDFAHSGNWYDSVAAGQGFTVEVNPISGYLFAAWYTYEPSGVSAGAAGQRWYTSQAAFTAGMRTIPVTIYETTGGIFDTPTPPGQQTVPVGSGILAFQSCTAATFSYTFTGGSSGGLSGIIPLSRVGPVPPGCTS